MSTPLSVTSVGIAGSWLLHQECLTTPKTATKEAEGNLCLGERHDFEPVSIVKMPDITCTEVPTKVAQRCVQSCGRDFPYAFWQQ